MSSELTGYGLSGATHYAVVYNAAAQVWNGTAFESVGTSAWTTYPVAMTEQSTSGRFVGNSPSPLATRFAMRKRVAGAAAITDPVVWEDALGLATILALQDGTVRANRFAITSFVGRTRVVAAPFFPEQGWCDKGAYRETVGRGNYFRHRAIVEGTNQAIRATFNTDQLVGLSSAHCPQIGYKINGGITQTAMLTNAGGVQTVNLTTTASDGVYDIVLWYMAVDRAAPNTWGSAAAYASVRFIALTGSSGVTFAETITVKFGKALITGDSCTEGERNLANLTTVAGQDASLTYGAMMLSELGYEYAMAGFGAQGWSNLVFPPLGGVPSLENSWYLFMSGVDRRDAAGRFIGGLHLIVINNGIIDAPTPTVMSNVLSGMRTAEPGSTIGVLKQFRFFGTENDLKSAFDQYKAANPWDVNTRYINCDPVLVTGVGANSYDGIHLTLLAHAIAAMRATAQIGHLFGSISAAEINTEADAALADADVTTERMSHLDEDVSAAPLSAAETRDALGLAEANLDSQLEALAASDDGPVPEITVEMNTVEGE